MSGNPGQLLTKATADVKIDRMPRRKRQVACNMCSFEKKHGRNGER